MVKAWKMNWCGCSHPMKIISVRLVPLSNDKLWNTCINTVVTYKSKIQIWSLPSPGPCLKLWARMRLYLFCFAVCFSISLLFPFVFCAMFMVGCPVVCWSILSCVMRYPRLFLSRPASPLKFSLGPAHTPVDIVIYTVKQPHAQPQTHQWQMHCIRYSTCAYSLAWTGTHSCTYARVYVYAHRRSTQAFDYLNV